MSRRVYQALGVVAIALSVGLVVFGIAAVLDIHMLPAAIVWGAATVVWVLALRDMQTRRRESEDEHHDAPPAGLAERH